ncbi:signal transducer and activator of transcription 6 isoform X2 [Eublepharis macularius]|uniref:Signal transducer and activator of transcription n=1 Tax=Eublepharis macularius TaxID=481883 RepID=A0AA97LL05_EUBMA|nr:signal transducer and activator of transcription 6 isoform X2 [Eublepharis macularius]
MTNSKMSLWSMVCDLPPEQFNGYCEEFPHSLRYFLGDWLENHPWEFITGSDSFSAFMANSLLSAMVERLQESLNNNCQPGCLLQFIANLKNTFQRDPLQLVKIVKQILEGEKLTVQNKSQHMPFSYYFQQEEMKFGFYLKSLQYKLQEIQTLHGNLKDGSGGSLQINTLDPQFSSQANSLQTLHALFQEVAKELEATKTQLLKKLDLWKGQQRLAGNGTPFDEDLAPLQKRFESLLDICFQFRLQVVASAAELGPELQSCLQECLENIFNALVKSAFLVEKQPPQVLKTQTKFQANVRFLLGPQLFKPPQTSYSVVANIVTEKQARELAAGHPDASLSENTGEIVNNLAPLETTASSSACCATFKNMLLKKIKRSDRKSTESVTEEKCAVLFSAKINLGSNKTTFLLQALSLPIVVIVHGNQDNNAKATILWDNAFAKTNRIPFVVPDRVSWGDMCKTLNQKFMAEVQTTKGLLREHYFFLAQKIFNDNNANIDDFWNRHVSWAQFNKEILPGRGFTFWQWFEGVLDLTKKYLKDYWSDRLIMGFISKQSLSNCLSNAPVGTFLLRFSDSVIGGISIAWLTCSQNGFCEVENIHPFTASDLSIRSLADCVLDLPQLKMLYPNRPKEQAFRNYSNKLPRKNNKEYVPIQMRITVGTPSDPAPLQQNVFGSMSNVNGSPAIHQEPTFPKHSDLAPPQQNVFGSMPNLNGSPGIPDSRTSDLAPLQQNLFGSMTNLNGNPGVPSEPPFSNSPMIPLQAVNHPSMSSMNTRYESPMSLASSLALQGGWIPQGNTSPLQLMDSHLLHQESAMDFSLPDLNYPGDMDCSLPSEPMPLENLLPPSKYEMDHLLHPEQNPLRYSYSPGPSLTNLCS